VIKEKEWEFVQDNSQLLLRHLKKQDLLSITVLQHIKKTSQISIRMLKSLPRKQEMKINKYILKKNCQ